MAHGLLLLFLRLTFLLSLCASKFFPATFCKVREKHPVIPTRGALPNMSYIGMCDPKGYGFSAILVINRVSVLAILSINRVWFLYPSLELGIFLRSCYMYFSIIIDETINKALCKSCSQQFNIGLN